MPRSLTIKNIMSKKFTTYPFTGHFKEVFGLPSTSGIWLIYGKDKNGKSSGTLMLCDYFSTMANILYISAEEGLELEFVKAITRAGINHNNTNLKFIEFEPVDTVKKRFSKGKRNKPDVLVFDNLTLYNDLGGKGVIALEQFSKSNNIIIIFLAHEERNEPYTSGAKMAKKLAKVIIRVQGLALIVSGRVPGGTLTIDEEKACLYHGTQITND